MRLLAPMAVAALALPVTAPAADPHSYAEPGRVSVRHVDLDLAIDFARRQLHGDATLTLEWRDEDATDLILDTRDLAIQSVRALGANDQAKPLEFTLAKRDKELGSKLTINATARPTRVRIAYITSPQASGLQWLTPAQTADGKQAFMFSQSESIHARSWVPLQDSPAIRFTYDARITAPKNVRVVMSAINDAKHPLDGDFRFHQDKPIPSYLLAIAAGDIVARETGPRSAVYAEPSVVGKAAREFEDTEKMIAAAEKLYGPYRWSRYDILVLPPSFPFGGMENPNMTFATPTIIAGDKSLVSVISHELAHSWSGNLVTAASWRDIWLNEGFTTYVQGRITEALYGRTLADEEALLSARALEKTIARMPKNAQRLLPEPRKVGADDALSDVVYAKGSWFLRFLEARYGRALFDAYLRDYFDHFAFQSITTGQMLDYLKAHLIDKYPGKVSWDEVTNWVRGTGIPDNAPLPDSPRFAAIDKQRAAFLGGSLAAGKLDAKDWNTQEWMYFLDGLPDKTDLARLKALDAAKHLTGTPNAEIGMRWYSHAIASGDKDVWTAAAEHMTRIGRLYLTLPLYKAFVKTPDGLAYAEAVYAHAKPGYHPMTQRAVDGIIKKAKKTQAQGAGKRKAGDASRSGG
ncbi:MAG: M1 family metallopeptidase [Rhodanobacteraceae bacterium]